MFPPFLLLTRHRRYPEEKPALADRRAFLKFASKGCSRFDLNKPAWSLESEINSFAGLLYW